MSHRDDTNAALCRVLREVRAMLRAGKLTNARRGRLTVLMRGEHIESFAEDCRYDYGGHN